jgi:hypothetical protein
MLEHGRPTNRGDLLTEGPEIMMGTDYFWRPKKKQLYYGVTKDPEMTAGGRGTTIIFESMLRDKRYGLTIFRLLSVGVSPLP